MRVRNSWHLGLAPEKLVSIQGGQVVPLVEMLKVRQPTNEKHYAGLVPKWTYGARAKRKFQCFKKLNAEPMSA
jgi:hypothetical protein